VFYPIDIHTWGRVLVIIRAYLVLSMHLSCRPDVYLS
jgi:hypothetical protein